MRFFNVLALAAGAYAATTGLVNCSSKKCLRKGYVDYLIERLTRASSPTWEAPKADFIADGGFFDYPDSINTVAGLETGFPIFSQQDCFRRLPDPNSGQHPPWSSLRLARGTVTRSPSSGPPLSPRSLGVAPFLSAA